MTRDVITLDVPESAITDVLEARLSAKDLLKVKSDLDDGRPVIITVKKAGSDEWAYMASILKK